MLSITICDNPFIAAGRGSNVIMRPGLITKTLRIMQITAIILLGICLELSANGYSQSVTFQGKNVPLENVLQSVKEQTGYLVSFKNNQMREAKNVTLHVSNIPLQEFLRLALKDQPFDFVIRNKTIFIRKKMMSVSQGKISLFPAPGFPPITIKGRIVNETDEPVLASIVIKGTSKGTSSNTEGFFELADVEPGATLMITAANIETTQWTVSGEQQVRIVVKTALAALHEVVINKGYYSTSRKLNTGTVGKVSAKEIGRQPVADPLAALQGRVPGLLITQYSGLPGSRFTVQIRGLNSIQNGNEPLYVVDGVVYASDNLMQRSMNNVNSPFSTLVPDDIESIEVLKDADATSLYGSRGGNGVVLITTKKGREGKSVTEVSLSQGWGKAARTMEYMNTPQFVEMRKEAMANDGLTPQAHNAGDLLFWDTTRYTDWRKFLLDNNANQTNAQIRLSGGSKLTTYSVSGNYYRESTIFPGDFGSRRLAFSNAVTTRSNNDKISFTLSSQFGHELNKLPTYDMVQSIRLAPNAPATRLPDGQLNWGHPGWYFDNPDAKMLDKYQATTNRLTSSASVNYKPLPGLTLRANGGFNWQFFREETKKPIAAQNPQYSPSGSASFTNSDLQGLTAEVQADYTFAVVRLFTIKTLIGSSWQQSRRESSALDGTGYTSDVLLNTIGGAAQYTASDYFQMYKYQAFSARVELNHKDKYVLNLTGKRDGSSRFGPGNRYANFGAVGVAWIFSDEPFFAGIKNGLSFGKIRASYGVTGNDQIGNYIFYDAYRTTTYPFGNQPGLQPIRLYNPDYSWEQKSNLDLSLDLGLLNNRINLNVTHFQSRSGSQIIEYTLPSQTGFSSLTRNFPGVVGNKGWEFEISSRNISSKQFTWTTSANLTIARNKLLSFPGLETSAYSASYVIGQPLGSQFLFEYNGVDPQTGLYTFTDVNKDGEINSLDMQSLRHMLPVFYGGLGNDITLGKIELSLFFQFVKQQGRDAVFSSYNPPGASGNQPALALDRWQKPGDIARYQRYTASYGDAYFNQFNVASSTAILTDASFIRLKNCSISYLLEGKSLTKVGMTKARIFIQAQNLLTITSYKGQDPENQSAMTIPPLKMITVGARLTF